MLHKLSQLILYPSFRTSLWNSKGIESYAHFTEEESEPTKIGELPQATRNTSKNRIRQHEFLAFAVFQTNTAFSCYIIVKHPKGKK